jgi:type IV fimbrial biogenesis protein FimT
MRRPSPRKRRGFTLIELLVVMAIAAIGMSLAAPGVTKMLAARKVKAASQSVLDGLNIARAEAVRRNTAVEFGLVSGGWTVKQVSPVETIRTSSGTTWDSGALTVASSTSATTLSFLATGLRGSNGTQMSQVDVTSAVTGGGSRRINIFGGGLIRMCDPAVTTSNDPRRC